LLYALEHEEQVSRLFILNTPLALNSKLRPELAAYKSPIPFLRPGNVSVQGLGYKVQGSGVVVFMFLVSSPKLSRQWLMLAGVQPCFVLGACCLIDKCPADSAFLCLHA